MTIILTALQQIENLEDYLASLNQIPTEEQRLALYENINENPVSVSTKFGVQIFGNPSEYILQSLSSLGNKKGIRVDGAQSRQNRLVGTNSADILRGGADSDQLLGKGGNDRLFGFAGLDIIYGGDGNDIIYAGAGNDQVQGENGFDRVTLGAGRDEYNLGLWDTYVNGTSQDVITDFNTSEDILTLAQPSLGREAIVNYDSTSGWVSVEGVNQVNIGVHQTGFSSANWRF